MSEKDVIFVNYYDVLEIHDVDINELPSISKIRRAYRSLALRYHPDKQGKKILTDAEREIIEKKFAEISEASEILQNDVSRATFEQKYRQFRHNEIEREKLDAKAKQMEQDLFARERNARRQDSRIKTQADQVRHIREHILKTDRIFKQRKLDEIDNMGTNNQSSISSSTSAKYSIQDMEESYHYHVNLYRLHRKELLAQIRVIPS